MKAEDTIHGLTGTIFGFWGGFLSASMLIDGVYPSPRVFGGFLLVIVAHVVTAQASWKRTLNLPDWKGPHVN